MSANPSAPSSPSLASSASSASAALGRPGEWPAADAERVAGCWNVRLLGALEARNGDVVLTHFVSQPIAALFAALALEPQRDHAREQLVERLWPGVGLDVGRNRLRNAISTLRRLLEPPGVPAGTVLVADRQSVRLAPNTSSCDALEFERAVRAGDVLRARSLYRGELLPGFYDDWIQDERARLAALHDRVEGDDTSAAPVGDPATPPGNASPAHVAWAPAQPTLPNYLSSFFGRERERAELLVLVGTHRLITVSGAGGCGKTRLAVEVAHGAAGFGCVAFVALADCRSAVQLTAQLRVALLLPKVTGEPIDQVVERLRDQRPLLVLDNFEQLVQAGGAGVVETLLERVPTLHLIVTSRRALGLEGERELCLRPLPQPEPNGSVEQVAGNPSVSLFVDRARSVRPDFQVTSRNHAALAALCGALEGLPLAIELAASRSRAFSPSDMLEALAQRFSLLQRAATRSGKQAGRHDSLHGAIDWSWRLLPPNQQRFLVMLSVFRGGWSAVSAQAISDDPEARDLLERLTADSLLRSETDASGRMRFFMLEMIREYLREHLERPMEALLRQRHRAHFLAQAMVLGQRSQAAPRDDLANLVEAMQTAVDDAEPALALALGVALRGEWEQHGMPAQVQSLMERALAQRAEAAAPEEAVSAALLVHAHLVLRAALLVAGESESAQQHATLALALAGTQSALRASALLGQARQHWERSRDHVQMRPLLTEALVLARQENAVEVEAGVQATLGTLAFHVDDQADQAIVLFGEAQRLYDAAGLEHLGNRMLFTQANCHAKRYRFETALELLAECERRFIASGHVSALLELANVQGFVYAYMVRWRDAELAFARCAVSAASLHNRYMMAFGLWNLARPLAHRREPESAALLMAFTARFWVANFGALVKTDDRYVEQVRRLVRVQIGAVGVQRLWKRAESMSLAQALDLAARSLQAKN